MTARNLSNWWVSSNVAQVKACKKCGCTKPIDEFYWTNPVNCKECTKAGARARRAEKIDEIRAYDRARGQLEHRREANKARGSKYREKRKEQTRMTNARFPTHRWARLQLQYALRGGRIIRPLICDDCGCEGKIQGHHDDYSKPLDVRWLCTRCHGALHRAMNEAARQAEMADG